MSKWNMIVDVARCENCHNCTLAVKDEHVENDYPGYAAPIPRHGANLIEIERTVRGTSHHVDVAYVPRMCNHCDDAPCLKAGGKDGAVRKRADGIVIIDPVKAAGRRDLVDSCPYGSISWNDELDLPQIWIFDAHLLDQGWKEPRASHVCPTQAMRAIKASDGEMAAIAAAENLRVLRPELGTKPRVYYRNLHRADKAFIAGTVMWGSGQDADCLEGADVVLMQGGQRLASMISDTFGDFKFDGLEPASGAYSLRVSHPQGGSGKADVTLDSNACVCEIAVS